MNVFEDEIKYDFLQEATESLQAAERCFLSLETAANDPSIVEELFRLAHNLKGSSRAVGFGDLADFTHELESLLLKIKTGELAISSRIVTLLLCCNDFLSEAIGHLKSDLSYKINDQGLKQQIEACLHLSDAPDEVSQVEKGHPGARISQKQDESVRVNLSRIDQLLNYVGELVILQTVMMQQRQQSGVPLMFKTIGEMSKIIKEVQSISMSMRMLPLKQTFQKMQRIVRDTSKTLGKDVNLEISGEETEMDKTVLEHLGDPLVHLVRNAVDHGIECESERLAAGKPAQGTVKLSAWQRAGEIIIEIRDDGRGLDAERLITKARQRGLIAANADLTQEQAHQLVFAPGLSTKDVVTDVSGRGVGMDVVKTNITNLQGEIRLESKLGQGTTVRITLPLTLAIVDGIVVSVGSEKYIVPMSQVTEFFQPSPDEVHPINERGEALSLRGQTLPIYRLDRLLQRDGNSKSRNSTQATIIISKDADGTPFSVLVDEVDCQQQVVIKSLGNEIAGLPGISGASILGDGKACLILDLFELTSNVRRARTQEVANAN